MYIPFAKLQKFLILGSFRGKMFKYRFPLQKYEIRISNFANVQNKICVSNVYAYFLDEIERHLKSEISLAR